jgi:carbamate kinase
MATDVDAIYRDFGTPQQAAIGHITPTELTALALPEGSMGPKAEAAISFARRTGRPAAIGTLSEVGGIVAGERGTRIEPEAAPVAMRAGR